MSSEIGAVVREVLLLHSEVTDGRRVLVFRNASGDGHTTQIECRNGGVNIVRVASNGYKVYLLQVEGRDCCYLLCAGGELFAFSAHRSNVLDAAAGFYQTAKRDASGVWG
jgi:hypothetical protein